MTEFKPLKRDNPYLLVSNDTGKLICQPEFIDSVRSAVMGFHTAINRISENAEKDFNIKFGHFPAEIHDDILSYVDKIFLSIFIENKHWFPVFIEEEEREA